MNNYSKIDHPLKREIYKKGFTLEEFANVCEISRWTLNNIFVRKKVNKTRGSTIYIISKALELPYEKVEVMCNGV